MRMIDRLLRKARARREDAAQWQGRFYDALSDEEREDYARYYGGGHFGREAIETVNMAARGTLHFELARRRTEPPTPEEHQEMLDEIEKAISKARERDEKGVPEL